MRIKLRTRNVKDKVTSIKEARAVTSKFHKLLREQEDIKKRIGLRYGGGDSSDSSFSSGYSDNETHDPLRKRLLEIKKEIKKLGGRKRYQSASIFVTKSNRGTSKWVFSEVTRLGRRPKSGDAPVRVLEVGAINTQLINCSWLAVRAIDIATRHEKIERVDFFDITESVKYDVVVSGMVINCVPDCRLRGEMLLKSARLLVDRGLFFVVLPARCLLKSKYLCRVDFVGMLSDLGLQLLNERWTDKVCYLTFEKVSRAKCSSLVDQWGKPKIKYRGKGRCDFCISFEKYQLS